MRQTRTTWNAAKLLALWAFISVWVAGPIVVGNHLRAATHFPLAYPFALAAVSGLFWTAVTRLVQGAVARLPFSRTAWVRPGALHLCGLVASALAHAWVFRLTTRAFGLQGDLRLASSADEYAVGVGIQLYVVIVAVCSIMHSESRARSAEVALIQAERLSAQARSMALRSQLNAHFLFNTLNTVAMAVRRSDRDEALGVVVRLGALLRTALRQDSSEQIALREEIDFVERYVDIEQVRFRDRMKVQWNIATAAESAAVPALILQPIVENAIRHGIEKRSDAGLLRISATVAGDVLSINVEDDGPGFDPKWTEGVGLTNVRQRLLLHAGARAKLDVVSGEHGGSVRLSLPYSEVAAHADV